MAANTVKKIVATALSTEMRKVCKLVSVPLPKLHPKGVLIKCKYAGINATDVNVSAGRYMKKDDELPLNMGLEGVGEVVDIGSDVPAEMKGKCVGYFSYGSFADYLQLPASACLPLPSLKPEYVSLLISGLTAAMCFDQLGNLKQGENVFISAAAGGTGHLAVQLAKLAGCHVIGTCSSPDKAEFLKSLGCDHVINYKEENLREVLHKTYPKGIDVFYESVGGDVFEACVNCLAVKGRLIVIGYIDSYHSNAGLTRSHRNATLVTKLLLKSASLRGFLLHNHMSEIKTYFPRLVNLADSGKLKVHLEMADSNGRPFRGLDRVFDAVDYLYSRQSMGKIVVEISE